ncbi:hypothetical protein HDV05_000844, partial [Chytridiales sp. JEL 0842]
MTLPFPFQLARSSLPKSSLLQSNHRATYSTKAIKKPPKISIVRSSAKLNLNNNPFTNALEPVVLYHHNNGRIFGSYYAFGILHCVFWFTFASLAYTNSELRKRPHSEKDIKYGVPETKSVLDESFILSAVGFDEFIGAGLVGVGLIGLGGVHA